AIIAAILFPVFARARENARRSACQSNVKQIGLGIHQYLQDNDERFPIWYSGPNANWCTPDCWPKYIQPYVKSEQIFLCPSRKKPTTTDIGHTSFTQYGLMGYATNEISPSGGRSFHLSQIAQPTRTWMLGETRNATGTLDRDG